MVRTQTKTRRKVGNYRTPAQREAVKKKFLEEYSQSFSITDACKQADIHPATYQYWLNTGFLTVEELSGAVDAYHDLIRKVLSDTALKGVAKQLKDSHGNPLFDANGNPLIELVRSERLLMYLANRLPENKGQQNGFNMTVPVLPGLYLNDTPESTYLVLHKGLLETDMLPDLKRLAERHEANRARAIANGWNEQSGDSPVSYLYAQNRIVEGTLAEQEEAATDAVP